MYKPFHSLSTWMTFVFLAVEHCFRSDDQCFEAFESELPPVGHANLPRAKDLALRCT